MTLEFDGAREQLGAARGANYSASEEDIQLLIDGAEVVLEGRRRREQQRDAVARKRGGYSPNEEAALAQGLKELGIDPRRPLQGETDLDNDRSAVAFGEDQSDFQVASADDKDFGKSLRNDNRVAYYDPDSEETRYYEFQEGQPTRRAGIPGKEGYQDSESWQQRRAIRQAALNKGYGPEISERRAKPVDRSKPGLRTEVQSRTDAPTARDTGGGYTAANDAASQLRARIASGELTEDSVISIDNNVTGKVDVNVGQLLKRLEENQPGRPAAMKDRAQGRAAVQTERRFVEGDLTPVERERESRRIAARRDRVAQFSPAAGYRKEGRKLVAMGEGTQGLQRKQGDIVRPSDLISDEVDARLEGKPERVRGREAMKEIKTGLAADADAPRRERIRAILDSQPDLEPGPKVYVNDSGIAEGDIPQGAVGASRNMKMVKLNDYQVVDPNNPANWRASELSPANQIVLGGGREYYDGSGNLIGDWEPDQLGYQAEAQVDDPIGKAVQNVPSNPVTVQDLAAQEIKKRQSAERMRQVSIGGSLDVLMDRLQQSPGGKAGAFSETAQPRSLADLQGLVDAVAEEGRGAGRTFYGFDPSNPGRSKRTAEPTARDILANTLKMSPDEIGNLTQALTMLDAGRDTSVPVDASPAARASHQFKEDYYAGGNAGRIPGSNPASNTVAGVTRAFPDAGSSPQDRKRIYGVDPTADPAALGRNALHHIGTTDSKDRVTVGIDAKGNPVRMEVGPQLRGLTGAGLADLDPSEANVILEMARSNQVGTFSGDAATPRVYQGPSERRSREDVILDSVKKYEGFGKAGDTAGIIRSANRDLQNEAALSGTDEAISRRSAELASRPSGQANADDAVFEAAARRRNDEIQAERSNAEVRKLEELSRSGRQTIGDMMIVNRGGENVILPPTRQGEAVGLTVDPSGKKFEFSDKVQFNQPKKPSNTQQDLGSGGGIRPSLRREQYVGPVTQPTRPAVTPSIAPAPGDVTGNQPAPQIDAGRGGPMPASMREELFALDGPLQGPEASSRNYMGAPDTSQSTRSRRMEQAAGLRRKRTGRRIAAGVGGAAGILGALGLSNMGKEEEQV